jgi:hypothetical protein
MYPYLQGSLVWNRENILYYLRNSDPEGTMSRRFTPKIVTANRLREGDVVYLTAHDQWSPLHHEAELIEDEAHAQMRLLHAAAQRLAVVGAYLADAKPGRNSAPAAPPTIPMASK